LDDRYRGDPGGVERRKEHAMGSKIPPQMWEKPEAFEDVPAEDEQHEGVVDDMVGHTEAKEPPEEPDRERKSEEDDADERTTSAPTRAGSNVPNAGRDPEDGRTE
jgi:hypothetical protein